MRFMLELFPGCTCMNSYFSPICNDKNYLSCIFSPKIKDNWFCFLREINFEKKNSLWSPYWLSINHFVWQLFDALLDGTHLDWRQQEASQNSVRSPGQLAWGSQQRLRTWGCPILDFRPSGLWVNFECTSVTYKNLSPQVFCYSTTNWLA